MARLSCIKTARDAELKQHQWPKPTTTNSTLHSTSAVVSLTFPRAIVQLLQQKIRIPQLKESVQFQQVCNQKIPKLGVLVLPGVPVGTSFPSTG